jgi:Fe-S-cluster-containing dehydrogenase component
MIVDVALCENCHNCTLSVKDEHVGNDFPGYAASMPLHGTNWIQIERRVRGSAHATDTAYLPKMCNHCDDAPCLRAGANDGAVKKRPDGIVIIDPEKAVGRKDLVESCPYGAISWNEELQLPQIWIFDAHLLDKGWKEPRGSQCCPTGALEAVKTTDAAMAERARREDLRVLKPELRTRPRVHYRNLHRFDHEFIAGSVLAMIDGRKEAVEGAAVSLLKDGETIASCTSDMFGDFKFDGLEPDSDGYVVEVSALSYQTLYKSVTLTGSTYIGETILEGC